MDLLLQPVVRPDITTILRKIKPYVEPQPSSGGGGATASEQSSREARLEQQHTQLLRKEAELQERERKIAQTEQRLAGRYLNSNLVSVYSLSIHAIAWEKVLIEKEKQLKKKLSGEPLARNHYLHPHHYHL